jgi:hypothetical protein
MQPMPHITWPHGRAFAFTIFDDTDWATVGNVAPVYRFLAALGVRTTKSVWPLHCDPHDRFAGQSLQDPDYLDFIRELQSEGFEIAYHGARAGDNPRSVTREALDAFRELIGHDPATYAQHAASVENLYWGAGRLSIPGLGAAASRLHQHGRFYGDCPGSNYFWGDLCRERIRYVRNYGFAHHDLFANDVWTPYHDPSKPFVNYWFSSSAIGLRMHELDRQLAPQVLDDWERRGALIILNAHFGRGLTCEGKVHPGFAEGMRRLAQRNGWFAPVATILDHLRGQRGCSDLTPAASWLLQARWARDMGIKVLRGRLQSAPMPSPVNV